MSRQELISEICANLEKMPEETLLKILEFLRETEGRTEGNLTRSGNLQRILEEDKNLLTRLAK
ncbi:MAG: hypothetical protein H6581_01125 [Bacteroidia bacterium]|nr:hypothetical protein [Bacteroidia bacterium]